MPLPTSPVDESLIHSRIQAVREQIPEHVEIMAVSKGYSADHIRAAYQAGIRHFGESRVQEAAQKQAQLQDLPDIIWHLIGHLQTNKVKPALKQFAWIDSVDSLRLAKLLNQKAWELHLSPKLCLQVKLAPDPNKSGWSISELLQSLPQLDQLLQVQISGLMTILPLGLDSETALELFRKLVELADHIQRSGYEHLNLQTLSMGMSEDYPLAVAAGSNLIRLGRALFAEADRKEG
ncbi:YggS family pyridoxal phosphate-dependent enzyme [Thermostichus vulcanus]|uniref:Pyridoxal phosphate homeostasis protein n=1 Tax=Thermostichus vulcanus str. 'Rupite' TaxID=2813851 RepID=A0ABT0CAX5_THEVL|nr:YggS family pyridoxal phosphate-dependent enzyme [Thermostichus vulcanus]MCJ2542923.1 YggS family pyridoxal phosphate-dependent enzyme [Thermostichus vulcanus str. 'Rupite']